MGLTVPQPVVLSQFVSNPMFALTDVYDRNKHLTSEYIWWATLVQETHP